MTIVNIQYKISHFLPDGSMNTSSGLGSSCVKNFLHEYGKRKHRLQKQNRWGPHFFMLSNYRFYNILERNYYIIKPETGNKYFHVLLSLHCDPSAVLYILYYAI
jgi:hypothetical protein